GRPRVDGPGRVRDGPLRRGDGQALRRALRALRVSRRGRARVPGFPGLPRGGPPRRAREGRALGRRKDGPARGPATVNPRGGRRGPLRTPQALTITNQT